MPPAAPLKPCKEVLKEHEITDTMITKAATDKSPRFGSDNPVLNRSDEFLYDVETHQCLVKGQAYRVKLLAQVDHWFGVAAKRADDSSWGIWTSSDQ